MWSATAIATFLLLAGLPSSALPQTPEAGGGGPILPPPLSGPVSTELPSEAVPVVLSGVRWTAQPSGEDFARHYPSAAVDRGVEGRVVLDCVVSADGKLSCTVVSEEPPGWGFAGASLMIATYFRVALETTDGVPTVGGRFRRAINWRIVG